MNVKLLNRVENIMTKGEIAHYDFKCRLFADESKYVCRWERVKTMFTLVIVCTTLQYNSELCNTKTSLNVCAV